MTSTKIDINSFSKILKDAFKIYDLENENQIDSKNINLNTVTTIEYIKLGNDKPELHDVDHAINIKLRRLCSWGFRY